ncbi:MAG: ATP phosphoribosyltransferase regulatory subunit [Acidobacteriota bacterium]
MKYKEVVKGAKDYLPQEAALKREFENQTVDIFTRWGYQEVVTPTFEYLEVIEAGAGQALRDELFVFQDQDGRLLALRPEMTIPIARIVATKLTDAPTPLRLFYNANLFRRTQPQMGRYKEFYQLGVELIGAPGPMSDAEVIALAAETLIQQGLEFKISMNHIGIVNSLLETSGFSAENKEEVKSLMLKKDLVGLGNKLSGLKLTAEVYQALSEIPVLHGGPEILNKLGAVRAIPGMSQAIDELEQAYSLLKHYNVQDSVVMDLGILRGFDYYTGIVFEGYSPNLGYPLLGGGRYDNLLGKFGKPLEATGFAVGVERVMLAMDHQKPNASASYIIKGSNLEKMIEKARELRCTGCIVEIDDSASDQEMVVEAKL